MNPLLNYTKRYMPEVFKAPLRLLARRIGTTGYEHELGMYVLRESEKFSKIRDGRSEALRKDCILKSILKQDCIRQMNEAHQYLQTAFMANYEMNLFEYYRQQQYLILLTFLGYPFRGHGCLLSHVEPFRVASSKMPRINAIDYGAGIPFGIIHLLRTCPEKIDSITIVDLDLIHSEISEYIVSKLAPQKDITFLRITDTESIPDLSGRKYNLIYCKDIFEHVHEPERLLRAILCNSAPSCICYFDIRDHGVKHLQHVHPQLSHLSKVICEHSFEPKGEIGSLSEYVKIRSGNELE
jgi:hypothetical protein